MRVVFDVLSLILYFLGLLFFSIIMAKNILTSLKRKAHEAHDDFMCAEEKQEPKLYYFFLTLKLLYFICCCWLLVVLAINPIN